MDENTFVCFAVRPNGACVRLEGDLTNPAKTAPLFDSDSLVRAVAQARAVMELQQALDEGRIADAGNGVDR